MGALALWLKTKVFSSSSSILLLVLIGLLAFMIIPNLELIKEKLGMETRATLKVKVAAQNVVIDDLTSSNDNLMNTIIVDSMLEKAKDEVVVKQIETTRVIKEASKEAVKVKAKKIAKVKQAKTTPVEQAQAISKIQIQTIWDSFCDFNTHQQCGVPT